jgi:hypothetical protein
MNLTIRHIPTEFCAQNWHLVEGFIKNAHRWGFGDYSVEQIKMYVTLGQWLLVVATDEENNIHGAMTVSFINYPNDRIAYVTSIGGKLISSKETFEQLSNLVKSLGATKIQGSARPSVARLWKRFGFKERNVTVEVKI